jgi:hypothetical protein
MLRKSKKYHKEETEREKMRALCYKLISENREWRDRYVGTLMMLAYDECLSESRAREIIGLDIYEWRKCWRKTCKTWADGQREATDIFKRHMADAESNATITGQPKAAPVHDLVGHEPEVDIK